MKIQEFCYHCGIKLPPEGNRCPSCNRMARLGRPLALTIAGGAGIVTVLWSAYRGMGWVLSPIFGTAMVVAVLMSGLMFRSKPLPFSKAPFSQTWGKELGFGFAVGLMIFALAAGEIIERGAPWYESLGLLVLGPAAIALMILPLRPIMWWFSPSVARCRSCGAAMGSSANYCSICGAAQWG